MPEQIEIEQLHTHELVARNQRELQKGAGGDARYAFVLFHRALAAPHCVESKAAWEALYHQYLPLVTRWATKHPLFTLTGETGDHFATIALANVWLYFARGAGHIAQFPDLRYLLRFIQVSVHNTVAEYYRNHIRRRVPDDQQGENAIDNLPAATPIERAVEQEELWREIYKEARTELERLWLYGYCELLLPRRDIARLFPQFENVEHVKQVMDAFVKRIRRNERLLKILAEYQWE